MITRLLGYIRRLKNPAYSSIALAVFCVLSLFLYPCFLPSRTYADDPLPINPSLTIGSSGTLAFDVTPGQFNSGSQSISVATSNHTGYNLTIAPVSGDSTALVNSVTSSTIPSIATDSTESSFASPSYGFTTDSTITSSTLYKPVTSGATVKETSSAGTDNFNLTVGAKVASNTPAGTYSRTFTLTASANDASYSISYNANAGSDTVGNFPSANEGTVSGTTLYLSSKTPTRTGYVFLHWNTSDDDSGTSYNVQGTINLEPTTANPITLYAIWEILCPGICYNGNNDDGTGTMPDQTVSNLSSSQTLIASNFSRAGYGFAGWSEDEDAYAHLTDNNQSNDPTIYGPNETITMPGHALNLYAVWVPAEKDGNNNPVYLQNWLGCASMNDGDLTALTDSRDNSVYAVVKIEKNVGETNEYSRCWLIESLRLDVATANITSENTNHPTITFLQEASALQSVSWDTCPDYSFACLDQISYSLGNINRNNTASHNADNQTSSWYSYGGMYNWYTATAGNGAFSTGNADVTSGSLCPASWNLPTGYDATGDYGKLDIALGGTGGNQYSSVASNRWRAYPFNHLLSGIYYESSALNRGLSGDYWSSSSFAFEAAWSTSFSKSFSNPGTNYRYKNGGLAIRCFTGNYWKIHFDSNTQDQVSGTMLDQTVEAGITTSLNDNRFSRPISGNTGYKFTGWNTAANGSGISYANGASVTDLVQAGSTITLYAQWESVTGPFLTVNFNGNDLTFDNSSNQNTVIYHRDCEQVSLQNPKYSHTSNVLDDGTQDGDYLDDEETNEVITIPGASGLHIELTFGGEYGYDWVSVWSGSHPDYSAYNDYEAEEMVILDEYYYDNRYASDDHTSSLVEGDISGDTVTFSFVSDNSYTVDSYGYYAVITGLDSNGDPISGTATVCSNTIISGEYKTPVSATSQKFYGWSESISATAPDYTNAKSIEDYLPGDNGQTKTLYAVWAAMHTIYFDENGADPAYGMVGNVQVIANGTSAELNEVNYSKSDYKFKGWNTDSSATTALYADQAIFTAPSSALHTAGVTTLYAIWLPVYTVQYNINGGDSGTMGTHTNITQGDEVTLYASNFSRANYGFAGWNTRADGTGTQYGPMETITAPAYPEGGSLTLYAKWVPSTGDLQSFDCSTLSSGEVTARKDTRDNQVYAVAKLADGACWMIENLRLDSAYSSDSSKAQGFGGAFIGLADPEPTPNFKYSTAANSIYSTSVITGDNQNYRFPRYNNDNTASRASNTNGTNMNVYSYGNYYTWPAAIASTENIATSYAVAETSICPTGWHLPYGGRSDSTGVHGGNTLGGYYYLAYKLFNDYASDGMDGTASNIFRAYPNNYVYSGYAGTYYPVQRGSGGYYWTSTLGIVSQGNTIFVHIFFIDENHAFPGTHANFSTYSGFAVRCVATPRYTLTLDLGTGVEHVYVDGNEYDDGDTISLEEYSSHTINMSFTSGYEFDSWSISGTGASVGSTSTQSTTVTIGSTDATLTASAKLSCISNITGNMQDALAPSAYCDGATGTMTDNRTTTGTGAISTPLTYTVAKLDGKLWMTQNLAITGTIPASGSNFSGSSFNVSQYDLATDGSTYCTGSGVSDSDPKGYSNVCSHYYAGDANTGNKPTAWYNYAAATAGSITGYSNSTAASSDICPAGWRLPTNTEQSGITSLTTNFSPVYGGFYSNGSLLNASSLGHWWSATTYDVDDRYRLHYNGGSLGISYGLRYYGRYIRCVRSS